MHKSARFPVVFPAQSATVAGEPRLEYGPLSVGHCRGRQEARRARLTGPRPATPNLFLLATVRAIMPCHAEATAVAQERPARSATRSTAGGIRLDRAAGRRNRTRPGTRHRRVVLDAHPRAQICAPLPARPHCTSVAGKVTNGSCLGPLGPQPPAVAFLRCHHSSGQERPERPYGKGVGAWTLARTVSTPAVIERRVRISHARITGAAALVAVSVSLEEMDDYPDRRRQEAEWMMAVQSTALACQNLLLAAQQFGLAACWMCAPLFVPELVRHSLDLPESWHPPSADHARLRGGRLGQQNQPGEATGRRGFPWQDRVLWR